MIFQLVLETSTLRTRLVLQSCDRVPYLCSKVAIFERSRLVLQSCDTKHCAAKRHVELEKLRFAHRANENSASQVIKLTRSALPHWESHCASNRTNGCERLRNIRRTRLHPQTPKMKREPYATHSGTTHEPGRSAEALDDALELRTMRRQVAGLALGGRRKRREQHLF